MILIVDDDSININALEIMLENTVGVGENPNIKETIEKELEIIASYEDKLSVLLKYFTDSSYKKTKKNVLNR